MKKKNFNTRTCLITRKKKNKNELIRLCVQNNNLVIDYENNKQGRGYYISSLNGLDNITIQKIIERKVNIKISQELIDEIKTILER